MYARTLFFTVFLLFLFLLLFFALLSFLVFDLFLVLIFIFILFLLLFLFLISFLFVFLILFIISSYYYNLRLHIKEGIVMVEEENGAHFNLRTPRTVVQTLYGYPVRTAFMPYQSLK